MHDPDFERRRPDVSPYTRDSGGNSLGQRVACLHMPTHVA